MKYIAGKRIIPAREGITENTLVLLQPERKMTMMKYEATEPKESAAERAVQLEISSPKRTLTTIARQFPTAEPTQSVEKNANVGD